MLRISKLADYATVIMTNLASRPERHFSATELARHVHLTATTTSKILKLLLEAGLLNSSRGAGGGYGLAKPANQISIIEVINAIDGDTAITECSMSHKTCSQETFCGIKENWRLINEVIVSALRNVSLADMTFPLKKQQLLQQKSEIVKNNFNKKNDNEILIPINSIVSQEFQS